MFPSSPSRKSSRFQISYDFVILSEKTAQENDNNFVNLLFDDLENTEERQIARFQLYLEEVLHLIIEGRELREFTKLIEQALRDYIMHIKKIEYPKISPRKKNNKEAQQRTLAIRTKSRKASDSILLMGNKVFDFLIDVIRENHQTNEDFILLLSCSPEYKAEKLSTFFAQTSKIKSNIKIESLLVEKIYLELIDERNGLTSDKENVMDLILYFTSKVSMPINETNIREYWKDKHGRTNPLSKPRLTKILDLINCYRLSLGKKRTLDCNNGDHPTPESGKKRPKISKSRNDNSRSRNSSKRSKERPAIRIPPKIDISRSRKPAKGKKVRKYSKGIKGSPAKTNNSRSQDKSDAVYINDAGKDLLHEEDNSDQQQHNAVQLSKEVYSTNKNDSVFCTDDKVDEVLDDEEETISLPEYAAQTAMRLSRTIACSSRLTVDNVLSIGYHIVDAVQKKLTTLKSNVNFIQNLQGRIPLYDDSATSGRSSDNLGELDANVSSVPEQEMDTDELDGKKVVDGHIAVSSTFTQCDTDSFNFLRTLNAEDFE